MKLKGCRFVLSLSFVLLAHKGPAQEPGLPIEANKTESKSDDPDQILAKCDRERWQSWCSESATNPQISPAPNSGRSSNCLSASLDYFQSILSARAQGVAEMQSSLSGIHSSSETAHAGDSILGAQQALGAKSSAEAARSSFASCAEKSKNLRKYIDSYSTDRNATRQACNMGHRGANENSTRIRQQNLDAAINYHAQTYRQMLPSIMQDAKLSADEMKKFERKAIESSGAGNFGSAIMKSLTAIRKDCELSIASASDQIDLAAKARSIHQENSTAKPSEGGIAGGKKAEDNGIVDTAKGAVQKSANDAVKNAVNKGSTELQKQAGILPKEQSNKSMNHFTDSATTPSPSGKLVGAGTPNPTVDDLPPANAGTRSTTTTTAPAPSAPANRANPTAAAGGGASGTSTLASVAGATVPAMATQAGNSMIQGAANNQAARSDNNAQNEQAAVNRLRDREQLVSDCAKLPRSGTLTESQKNLQKRCQDAGISAGT